MKNQLSEEKVKVYLRESWDVRKIYVSSIEISRADYEELMKKNKDLSFVLDKYLDTKHLCSIYDSSVKIFDDNEWMVHSSNWFEWEDNFAGDYEEEWMNYVYE